MEGIKNILIQVTEKEYEKGIEYKNTHNKPTWREMLLDYIELKKLIDEIESE